MTPAEIAKHATRADCPAVNERDAEIAAKIVGVLIGRPFDERHAIGPARIIAAYREEACADERLRLFEAPGSKFRSVRKKSVRSTQPTNKK